MEWIPGTNSDIRQLKFLIGSKLWYRQWTGLSLLWYHDRSIQPYAFESVINAINEYLISDRNSKESDNYVTMSTFRVIGIAFPNEAHEIDSMCCSSLETPSRDGNS